LFEIRFICSNLSVLTAAGSGLETRRGKSTRIRIRKATFTERKCFFLTCYFCCRSSSSVRHPASYVSKDGVSVHRCAFHFLCPFAVYYLRYAVTSFFTISRIYFADGKRAGQKVLRKIAVAVQNVKPLYFLSRSFEIICGKRSLKLLVHH
jgi:hypothetical protein